MKVVPRYGTRTAECGRYCLTRDEQPTGAWFESHALAARYARTLNRGGLVLTGMGCPEHPCDRAVGEGR